MTEIIGKKLNGQVKLAIVTARFNEVVTQRLHTSAVKRIAELNIPDEYVTYVWVPGAIEVPLVAQCLAKQNQYDAIITLGAVIRGETSHYDYVCEQVSQGCQQVMLQYGIPIIFGILTTENKGQALARAGGGA